MKTKEQIEILRADAIAGDAGCNCHLNDRGICGILDPETDIQTDCFRSRGENLTTYYGKMNIPLTFRNA